MTEQPKRLHRDKGIRQANAVFVQTASGGKYPLTRREAQVIELLAKGHSNVQIGIHLDISVDTARKHVERIYTKLGVHNRAQAAYLWGVTKNDTAAK